MRWGLFSNLRHRGTGGGTGGGGTTATFPPSYPAPQPGPGKWLSFLTPNMPAGTQDGGSPQGTAASLLKAGNMRRREVEGVAGYHDDTPNSQINEWSFVISGWQFTEYKGNIELAPGGLYTSIGESWERAANGDGAAAGDGKWRARLVTMLNMYNSSIITAKRAGSWTGSRLAHECNGDWYQWKVSAGQEAAFRAAWFIWWTLAQQMCPSLKIGYSFNGETTGGSNCDIDAMIEVDANGHMKYGHYLSVDRYDNYPHAVSEADFVAASVATKTVNGKVQPLGIEKWRQMAERLGVPLVISEWSIPTSLGEAVGFMTAFYAWLDTHKGNGPGQVMIEMLFNVPGYGSTTNTPMGEYRLFDEHTGAVNPQAPLSSNKYLELW